MSTYRNDFPRDLGPLGLTIRLRRIADRMTHDARRLYRELGLDIEPSWHAVLLLVEGRSGIGVAEIARRLGMTHPSVSILVAQLAGRGYLECTDDPSDGRKRVIRLSRKAKRALPSLKETWSAGGKAIQAMIEATGHDVLATISALEEALSASPFDERTLDVLEDSVSRSRG